MIAGGEAFGLRTLWHSGRRRAAILSLLTLVFLVAAICASAAATVKQQLHWAARMFNHPSALAADRAGSATTCPVTAAQVQAALPLSSGLQEQVVTGGCVFYTGTAQDLAVDRQPVKLFIRASEGRINSEWLSGMGSALCSLGTSRNANGPTADSLCGITRKQRQLSSRTGTPMQTGLTVAFEAPDHKVVWTVSLVYASHLNGFRLHDPEAGLLAVLRSFA